MPPAPNRGRKIVAMVFITALLSSGVVLTARRFTNLVRSTLMLKASPERKFMFAWNEDVERLRRGHYLPPAWDNLRSVQMIITTDRLKKTFKQYPILFSVNPHGQFSLEVFVDEIEDNGGVVVQYDIIDLKSGNLVWELGRTFPNKLSH